MFYFIAPRILNKKPAKSGSTESGNRRVVVNSNETVMDVNRMLIEAKRMQDTAPIRDPTTNVSLFKPPMQSLNLSSDTISTASTTAETTAIPTTTSSLSGTITTLNNYQSKATLTSPTTSFPAGRDTTTRDSVQVSSSSSSSSIKTTSPTNSTPTTTTTPSTTTALKTTTMPPTATATTSTKHVTGPKASDTTKFEIYEVLVSPKKISTSNEANSPKRITPTSAESSTSNTFKPFPAINQVAFESTNPEPEIVGYEQSRELNQKSFSIDPFAFFNGYYVGGWNDTDVKASAKTGQLENKLQMTSSVSGSRGGPEASKNDGNDLKENGRSNSAIPTGESDLGHHQPDLPELKDAIVTNVDHHINGTNANWSSLNWDIQSVNVSNSNSYELDSFESKRNQGLSQSIYTEFGNGETFDDSTDNVWYSSNAHTTYHVSNNNNNHDDEGSKAAFIDGEKVSVTVEEYQIPDFLRFAVPMMPSKPMGPSAMRRKTDLINSSYAKAKFV